MLRGEVEGEAVSADWLRAVDRQLEQERPDWVRRTLHRLMVSELEDRCAWLERQLELERARKRMPWWLAWIVRVFE